MKPKTLLYALPVLMLVSCSGDDPGQGSSTADGAAVVTADIGSLTSRASGTLWSANDRIGISGTTGPVTYTNVPYVTADGSGNFTALNGVANGIFFQDGAAATFSAYYPYSEDVTGGTPVITASTADQSQAADFDFLYANGARGSLANPALNFTGEAAFKHSMAQLVVKLTTSAKAGFTEGIKGVTTDGRITVGGIKHNGRFDTATGEATANGYASTLVLQKPQVAGNTASYSLILFPQTAEDVELVIAYEGNSYSCTFTPTLAAGKRYTVNATLSKTGLTVATAEIADWTAGGSTSGDMTIPSQNIMINGHEAALMREATDSQPALYFATCNIGADTPEGIGLFFWWGDTVGHSKDEGYYFHISNSEIITNRRLDVLKEEGIIDDNKDLTEEYDAATQKWGSPWHLLTNDDANWLLDNNNCIWIWSDEPQGYTIISRTTGGTVFLPITYFCSDTDYIDPIIKPQMAPQGKYWTNRLNREGKVGYAGSGYSLSLTGPSYSSKPYILGSSTVSFGFNIRPVANL